MTDALPEAAPLFPDALLDLEMPPEGVRALLRLAAGRRARPAALVWHDTAGAELAHDGLALCEAAGRWRLERLWPTPAHPWPPGAPAPLVAEAADALGIDLPGPPVPIAAFQGQRRVLQLRLDGAPHGAPPVEAELLEGRLRGVAADAPVCRVRLRGAPDLLGPACRALAGQARLHLPRATLAADALRENANEQDRARVMDALAALRAAFNQLHGNLEQESVHGRQHAPTHASGGP